MGTALVIQAEPEPVEIDPERTAVIVVDMQNAFVSKGGMFDLYGMDIEGAQRIIEPCKNVIEAARQVGCKIVYLRHGYHPDLSNAGGENSPNWHKELALILMRQRPELKGKLLIRGTWDADIIGDLKPKEGDILVWKQRYSGFVGTELDIVLKTHSIKHVVLMGVAANGCVDSTLRMAFFAEYFPTLISDATNYLGPSFTHDATMYIVKLLFGWVTDSKAFCKGIRVEA